MPLGIESAVPQDPDKVRSLKDLLQTGLLEVYMFVTFMAPSELAYYVLVMNARKESGNKRPSQYIFLDNGKSLRDVLNACKANLSESLETVILKAIGRSNYTTAFCINCKEFIPEAGVGRSRSSVIHVCFQRSLVPAMLRSVTPAAGNWPACLKH
ncbi:UNVERIFIED_CONTAM: hypothetical protein Slati_3433300 [Sesamum latifolium]|uniref:Uncharacterized protein n=1 Tax=Sesamum latifolium TaxID=2727402 RepID=A0AAW2UGC0_9LAMI